MAALGQRLPLFFVGHQGARTSISRGKSSARTSQTAAGPDTLKSLLLASREFLQEHVSSYLRIVSEVSLTESYVTATPSEPPVSLAVASEFRGSDINAASGCQTRWSMAVSKLAEAHRSVGLLLGKEGEECIRLLISMAADLVAAERVQKVCANGQLAESDVKLFRAQCDPICLRDWLEKLFANGKHNWYQLHRDHHPQPDRDVLQWASDYYLNFTHFVKLGITVVPDQANPALLVEYWCRQAAIYGIVNQNNWGMLIPIYHSPSSAPGLSDAFDPNQLSYVAIQVKNCFSPVKATDRFGPSCFYSETSPTSADATADPNAARRLAEIETMATFSQRLPGNLFLICVVAMASFFETLPSRGSLTSRRARRARRARKANRHNNRQARWVQRSPRYQGSNTMSR